ncbi:hypothetical protein KL915_001643 [Ogataea haglerorum]|nr:hypothetical protein KL915_001643 [Ogataea haglerorum]
MASVELFLVLIFTHHQGREKWYKRTDFSSSAPMQYSPANITVDSDEVTDAWKVCVMNGVYFGGNEYSGSLGVRVSSVFVILFVSTCFTMFPLVARRIKSLRIPELAYLLARHFGSGVILATAYVHLMDPAYEEIGPSSCVGMSGHWADYSWPPALMLISVATIFTLDVYSEVYVEQKYGPMRRVSVVDVIAGDRGDDDLEQELTRQRSVSKDDFTVSDESMVEVSFRTQIAAFLILEFGVVFHSVMIGLNLGACGYNDFRVLYPAMVFHQSFEGLGIGARLSAIPFAADKKSWPWLLCLLYGLTTPICVAIGIGVRTTYNPNSFAGNIVQGVLNSISAGILMYTALVELIARDFLFGPERPKTLGRATLLLAFLFSGAGIMALLGKWA